MNKEGLLKAFTDFLDKTVGESESTAPVIKQFDQDKMEAIEWLYPLEEDDLHGEAMNLDEIKKMVTSLNEANTSGKLSPNIGHVQNTDSWYLVKAWVNETDCYIGDTFVPEGWPLAKTQFVDKSLWEARKDGRLTGLSIGARGKRVTEESE